MKVKKIVFTLAPLLGLLLLIVGYFVFGSINDINVSYGLKSVINQSVVVAIVATGAVFIYTLGSFDISLGASTAVSALVGGIVYLKTESIVLMFVTCVGVAIAVALINSVLASVFNLPVFVTTIAMLSVLNALVLMLVTFGGGAEISVPAEAVRALDNTTVKLVILVLYIALCFFLFEFTPIGRKEKALGGNPLCAKLTGISIKKYSIIAFVICGIGVGLGAFLSIIYAPTLTRNTASSIGMDVIIAIVFGGMPVSGGARSRIYAAVIGAFSMGFLGQIMVMLNLNSGVGQIVKSVIFLLVVFVAAGERRVKTLPR
ncbi:MAG: inner-membrane translocator [Butyrivibrio sp.]|nr:inner-membrane translocator [Butyrivibrio sp.]